MRCGNDRSDDEMRRITGEKAVDARLSLLPEWLKCQRIQGNKLMTFPLHLTVEEEGTTPIEGCHKNMGNGFFILPSELGECNEVPIQ